MIGGLKHLKAKAEAGKRDPGKVLQKFIVGFKRVIDLFRPGGEGAPDVRGLGVCRNNDHRDEGKTPGPCCSGARSGRSTGPGCAQLQGCHLGGRNPHQIRVWELGVGKCDYLGDVDPCKLTDIRSFVSW